MRYRGAQALQVVGRDKRCSESGHRNNAFDERPTIRADILEDCVINFLVHSSHLLLGV
jgi:hypothetical protein